MNLKKLAVISTSVLTFLAAGVYSIGLPNREKAEKILKQEDYTILRYDGHSLWHRDHGDIFSDRFKVIDTDGNTKEVVVTSGLSDRYNIRAVPKLKKDQPKTDKPKYNPFKIPKQ